MADKVLSVDMKDSMDMLARMKYDKVVKSKDIRKEVRRVITPAKKSLQETARGAIPNDPRKAYKAVKITTYKDGNGGNVSILNRKGGVKSMVLTDSADGGLSGIRRKRKVSKRTKQIRSYTGADRAFILRFINSGTSGRTTETGTPSYRGAITARNFFQPKAEDEMRKAAEKLSPRIVKLIEEVSEGK